jgi:hypothetical protein
VKRNDQSATLKISSIKFKSSESFSKAKTLFERIKVSGIEFFDCGYG